MDKIGEKMYYRYSLQTHRNKILNTVNVEIVLEKFVLLKSTPKGVNVVPIETPVDLHKKMKRFINTSNKNRQYAYESIKDALQDFLYRKKSELKHLNHRERIVLQGYKKALELYLKEYGEFKSK